MKTAPTHFTKRNAAFENAIAIVGGQIGMAKIVKRTQGAISKRLNSGLPIWHDVVLAVEAATGISRHDLRPDIYPREPAPASPDAPILNSIGAA